MLDFGRQRLTWSCAREHTRAAACAYPQTFRRLERSSKVTTAEVRVQLGRDKRQCRNQRYSFCEVHPTMPTAEKFRIDVAPHALLVNSTQRPPAPAEPSGLTLPQPVFPQFP